MAERKVATLLFADLAGSTALADEQDPERTRARLERFYDAVSAEIEAAGGEVEKFAGDAVMAAFGAPRALEDHAERALHAALAMQRGLEDGLALRVGVNTGDVVVGDARAGSSFVSGDAVNVAARLEQAAEPDEILVSERTAAAVRGAFEFGEPITVTAKGKTGGIPARRLRRAVSLMRPRGVGALARAFVGRDDELGSLRAAYRRVVETGRPVLVTIVGEAGVGKTRLVREFWERLGEEDPEPLRRIGRCLVYGQGITYWPLAEVLKEHLGILESDSPQEVRRRLGEREILGLTLGLDVAGDLHPLAARDRLHEAWCALLSTLGASRPVVLAVEDVHWAEEPVLNLLERLARDVEAPLLLLATARPDFVETHWRWGGPRVAAETIWLEPLRTDVARTLVDALLASDIPAEVRQLVVDRAEGNPFFVEEVLGSLIDQGVLERVSGRWAAHELPPGFGIPDSVQAVLASRIDLLDEPEKVALQAAAVIGRVFWTGPVYELVGAMEPDLRVLEDRDFIRRRPGSSFEGEAEYAFKHALTREVAYAGLPKARRARLHANFAEWIARVGGSRDQHAPLLAHHYAEAVRPEDADLCWQDAPQELRRLRAQAVRWLERAAHLAIGRYEIDDALALLHSAIELEPDESTSARIWRTVGRANALKYDGEGFWTALERSLAVCGDREIRADSYADLAFQTALRSGMWSKHPEDRLVDGWIERALEMSPPGSASHAKALIARCLWAPAAGRKTAGEARAMAELLHDVELRSYSFMASANTAFGAAHYDEALRWAERGLELLEEISDPDHVADIYEFAIPACSVVGRLEEARRLSMLHRRVVETLSPHHRLHGVAIALEVEEMCGGWERILDLADHTRAAVEANLATPCVRNARSLLVTALAAALTGDGERAESLEGRANAVVTEGYDVALTAPRAQLALVRGDIDLAVSLVSPSEEPHVHVRSWYAVANATARLDALAAARDRDRVEREAPLLLGPGIYMEPFALRALGIVRDDSELVERALARFREMGLGWHAAQTQALL